MEKIGRLLENESAALLRTALYAGTAWLAVAVPLTARAQEATQPEAKNDSEIIVTAQRRAERLEDVPMAITAITPALIERAGVNSIQDLARIAPGVLVSFNGFATQPAIRGVTALTNGNGFDNNVAVYIDGFYAPDMISVSGDLANLAGIEILKGPQGTLYGRNATGGAILINTLAPSHTLTGKFEVGYGRFDEKTASGYVSGPISNNVRFSLAGFHRDSNGYIKKVDPTRIGGFVGNAAPMKQDSIRAKLEIDLSSNLTATLAYNYGYVFDPRGVLFANVGHPSPALPAPPLRATARDTASFNRETLVYSKTNEATLKLVLRTGIGTLTSYSGFARRKSNQAFDFDGTYSDFVYNDNLRFKWDTYQQSLDFVVDTSDAFDLVVGGSYYKENRRYDLPGSRTFQGGVQVLTTWAATRSEAWAGYVDATWHVTDALSLTAGGRYNSERRTIDFRSSNPTSGAVVFPETQKEVTYNKFVPRAAIRYELGPRTNLYATYSEGFRSGAWNLGGAPSPALLLPIQPESIKAYEIGFKTAQASFRFDLAGFYYDYTGFHVSTQVPNPLCGCGVVTLTTNAPGATIYGIDGQVNWKPTESLNLRFGAAWVHARYGTFTNANGTGLDALTNLNIPGQRQDWTGQQMARAPNFSANGSIDYEVALLGGKLLTSVNVAYTDGYVVSNPSIFGPSAGALANQQRYRQGAYTLVDAQASWTDPSDRFTLTIWGKNLTNKRYWLAYAGANFGDYGVYAPPRTYGAKLGFKF